MLTGTVFDIREFTVHDGPGIRTTVFLKGCPLRCSWCHNPEGISPKPETMESALGKRTVGRSYTSQELASVLNRDAEILSDSGGGVTFSGGEPLAQAAFLAEVIGQLKGLSLLLDTSGYAPEADFRRVAERCHMVYFDLKLVDRQAHLRHTHVDNAPILRNLSSLPALGLPFVLRVPLIPGLTDTDANLESVARLAGSLAGLARVDLLPYNAAAGAKYASVGRPFRPTYDERQVPQAKLEIFARAGVAVRLAGKLPSRN